MVRRATIRMKPAKKRSKGRPWGDPKFLGILRTKNGDKSRLFYRGQNGGVYYLTGHTRVYVKKIGWGYEKDDRKKHPTRRDIYHK